MELAIECSASCWIPMRRSMNVVPFRAPATFKRFSIDWTRAAGTESERLLREAFLTHEKFGKPSTKFKLKPKIWAVAEPGYEGKAQIVAASCHKSFKCLRPASPLSTEKPKAVYRRTATNSR